MADGFDKEQAKRHLQEKEALKRERREAERKQLLERTIARLREYFEDTEVHVILVGSITVPNGFGPQSDIDIVLKGFTGDLFGTWADLERLLGRDVEVILYETSRFQDHIEQHGIKVN